MIRFAAKEDYPALKAIWHDCFGDGRDALDFLFSDLQRPENMLVYINEDGILAATLSLHDFALQSHGDSCKASYLYGVATLPEYQGKGFSTALLDVAHGYLEEKGYACSVLAPAEESLFGFYKKRGYETAFWLNKIHVVSREISSCAPLLLKPLTLERFEELRDGFFGVSGLFARWGKEYLSFILRDCAYWGGGAYEFSFGGQDCYAVCYHSGGKMLVKELAAPAGSIGPLLSALLAKFQAEEFVLYLPKDVQTSYTNNILPFAMVRWYDNIIRRNMSGEAGRAPYIAHVLD